MAKPTPKRPVKKAKPAVKPAKPAKKPAVKKIISKAAAKAKRAAASLKAKTASQFRPKAQAAPRATEPNEPIIEPTEEQIKHLIDKGRNRGFLTEKEVLALFPYLEHYVPTYEFFVMLMDKNSISLVQAQDNLLGMQVNKQEFVTGLQGEQPDQEEGYFDLGSI